MKRNFKLGLAFVAALATATAIAHTNDTVFSRLLLTLPDLGHEGGATLMTKIENLVKRIGDNMDSRYEEFTSVANSATVEHLHNYNVPFSDLVVVLWDGTGAGKTLISDPVAAGYTIAADGTFPATTIDITAPAAGGPHDFSVEVKSGFGSMAVQDANAVAITGGTLAGVSVTSGTITGITDLAVADGGTGASTATNARTNLGLGSIATQDASAVAITGGSVTNTTIVTSTVDDYLTINEETAPGTPASGKVNLYALSDGKVYRKDDTGTQYELGGAGGAGEISVIGNPNDATGWASTGAGVTVVTTTTSTDLPLGGVVGTAIKITPVSGTTDYAYYCWTQPDALKNRKLKVSQEQRPLSGYASGDLKLDVYSYATASCGGAAARVALSTDASSVTGIPNATGRFTTTFDADGSDFYGIRYTRVAGTTALNLASVIVGPGVQPQGAIVGANQPLTVTLTNGTGLTQGGSLTGRRVGEKLHVTGTLTFTGTGSDAGTFSIAFTGYTISSGNCTITAREQQATDQLEPIKAAGSAGIIQFNVADGVANAGTELTGTNIGSVTNGDYDAFYFTECSFAVSEWAGGGTVNLVQNDCEYAYNSSATDATDTTSFGYGPDGVNIVSFTAQRSKRAQFQSPIRATDSIEVQLYNTSDPDPMWALADSYGLGYVRQNTADYGISWSNAAASAVNVAFHDYGIPSGATFGSAGTTWATYTSYKWRVKKCSSGQSTGTANATTTSAGLVTYLTQTLGGGKTIQGNADEVQLLVKGNTTQTGNTFEVRSDGGTFRAGVSDVGYLGLGSETTPDDGYIDIIHNGFGNGDHAISLDDPATVVGAGFIMIRMDYSADSTATGGTYLSFHDADAEIGSINVASGTTVAYSTTSDARLKHDIVDVDDGLAKVLQIRPRYYKWNENDQADIGFIAQELKLVYPSAVSGDESGDPQERPMQVDYSKLTPVLTAAIQEMYEKVAAMENQLQTLQGEFEAYKAAHP